ncbi:MAG: scramblase [PVC group bacterium]|nr:scramblase [PVC group bacterium]
MERLENRNKILVTQKKEWGEILSGFETKNKYIVKDENGQAIYLAAEIGGSVLARIFLKALRPFTLHVMDEKHQPVLKLQRPFRFYFHRIDVFDSENNFLGHIERQFSLFSRQYLVFNESRQQICQLYGPFIHPWTFLIKQRGRELGKITKKWSGLFKEGFTDADNFAVLFPEEATLTEKSLFLSAVFLIDFVHFENTGNR